MKNRKGRKRIKIEGEGMKPYCDEVMR